MALKPGDIVDGKYRIVRLLGQGGMGAVYEGENTRIHRRVAIKVLHASVASKESIVKRFEQEAKAAGLIGSEHIVEVLDIGSLPSNDLFMVMEFLEGEDLTSRIKRNKRLSPHEAAPIVHQLLEGLAAAHKAGIIHRDLKPDNVFLLSSLAGRRDFVKVLDFGVSKFSALDNDGMSMTSTGAVMGTPYYLSPEQARGLKTIDARSDLYSVGVVLYQSVTGRLPFHAETFNELVFKIALEEPQPAENVVHDLDPSFAAIIRKAMVRDVNGRFQSAREFQEALAHWMAMSPSPDAPRASLPERAQAAAALGPQPSHSGTIAMEQATVVDPPPGWPSAQAQSGAPTPQPSNPGAHYGGAAAPQPVPYGAGAYGADPYGAQPGAYPGSASSALGYGHPGAAQPGVPMTTPQPGVSMTTPQPGALQTSIPPVTAPPRKSGAVVAVAVVGVIALVGGGLAAYKLLGSSAPTTDPVPVSTSTSSAQAPVEPPPTSAPSQTPSANPAASSSATPPASAGPSASSPSPPTSASAPPLFGQWPPKPPPGTGTPSTSPTPPTTAPPKPTGRVIGSEL